MGSAREDFFRWFEALPGKMAATEHGRMMLAAGWKIAYTAGGCLSWEKVAEGEYPVYVWISDQESGLGETADETYTIALYTPDGDPYKTGPDNLNLAAARSLADEWLKDPRKYLASVS